MAVDRSSGVKAAVIAAIIVLASSVSAEETVAPPDTITPTDTVTFGVETYESSEAAVRALFARQAQLESALRVLQQQLREMAAITNATSARLARGDEPLVSLEIEQLWAMVRSLEEENARLRDGYEELLAVPGE